MAERPTKRQKRHLNYDKCRFCRKAKKACTPVERTWPQKCQRCIELELECSENSRATGAPTSMPPQLSAQAMGIEVMRDLSLRAMWLGRLNFYDKAAKAVWDAQEKLFNNWRHNVSVSEKHVLVHSESISYYKELSDKMFYSDDMLAVFVAHTFVESTPLQCVSPFPNARIMVDRASRNGDVNTALAMQEIMLLHHPKPMLANSSAYTQALSKYCDLFQKTIERLEIALRRQVPAIPPLHYYCHLTKHKEYNFEDSHFVFMKDYYERSLLHVALDLDITLSERCLSLLKQLSSAGDTWGRRPIHIACTRASNSVMESILDITADCDVEDCLGRSALHYASSCGNEHAVRQLLQRGARVNHEDRENKTPVLWAIGHGHTSTVRTLLKSGADVSFEGKSNTALLMAAHKGYTGIVEALLEHGADVNLNQKLCNSTALHVATSHGYGSTVELLLKSGAKVNEKDAFGDTALHIAARHGHDDVVDLLLGTGAEINKKNDNGDTALLLAVKSNNASTVAVLLRNNARVDEKNQFGNSALSLAVDLARVGIVRTLLRNGVNVDEKDRYGTTALLLAVKKRRVDIVQELLKNGASVNETANDDEPALLLAVQAACLHLVEILLRNGADVNKKSQLGETPLLRASRVGDVRIVRELLRNGAKVDENLYGVTALMEAATVGNAAVVRELLKHGATIDLTDTNGQTASSLATLGRHADTIKLLLEYGVDSIEKIPSTSVESTGSRTQPGLASTYD